MCLWLAHVLYPFYRLSSCINVTELLIHEQGGREGSVKAPFKYVWQIYPYH